MSPFTLTPVLMTLSPLKSRLSMFWVEGRTACWMAISEVVLTQTSDDSVTADTSIMRSYGASSSLTCCQKRISLMLLRNLTVLSRMVISSLDHVATMLETVDSRDVDIKELSNILNRFSSFKQSDSLIPLKLIQSWHC
jgi:hypothetical protein